MPAAYLPYALAVNKYVGRIFSGRERFNCQGYS